MTTPPCPYAALYEPEFHADPHTVNERLRKEYGPVIPVELEPGVRGWSVIDYATLIAWCRDTRTFSRDSRRWRDWREGRVADGSGTLGMMMRRPNVLFADGAEHQRLRRAVTDSLAAMDATALTEVARASANQLVDAFCERGEAEILEDYARLLPFLVINHLFGFEEENARRFAVAMRDLFDGIDVERSNAELERVASAEITRKRRQPGKDVTTGLLEHRAELADEEILQHLVLIVGAGNEPTANLIANAMRILLTDRDLGDDVAGSRTSIEDAVDRVLWTDSPLTNYPVMYPTSDIPLANGQEIKEGEPVMLGYAAANRSVAHEYAESMGSAPNRAHLAFGVGPHRCPAQDTAIMIATTGLRTLLRRLPGLRLAVAPDELEWRVSIFARSLTRLPVAFDPQAPLEEGTPWKQSPSSPETSTASPDTSAPSGRSSLSNFLARLMRGR
ncbi:cytochrome P450 [Nocardiopsis sediminis]|uniref:Cytochrome P450 n=1 Tax=Nocardiopsis sediminis TaxID=1778267 RepID=A0ABV8FPZ3_9ACTN